jgi:anti-anti-sigma factor
MGGDGTLEVQVERCKGAVVLIPHGEVDLSTAPVLEDALRQVIHVSRAPVVVDLSDLGFLGCRGFGVLAAARAELSAAGLPLVMTGAQGPVQRVLQVCEDIGP